MPVIGATFLLAVGHEDHTHPGDDWAEASQWLMTILRERLVKDQRPDRPSRSPNDLPDGRGHVTARAVCTNSGCYCDAAPYTAGTMLSNGANFRPGRGSVGKLRLNACMRPNGSSIWPRTAAARLPPTDFGAIRSLQNASMAP